MTCALGAWLGAQEVRSQTRAGADALARRVNDRIAALQAEANRLATQSRTLLGDLRQLEIQRDIEVERARQADVEVQRAQASLKETADRITALEQERVARLPDLKLRLADLYMRGRGGYARTLLDARGVREFARAMRAAAALNAIAETRIAEQRQTLTRLREERTTLEQRTRELQAASATASRERAAADRAVQNREALVAQIDDQRDLNAQLSGELTSASDRLRDYVANLAAGRPAEPVAVPLTSFRGGLDWPVMGRLIPGLASAEALAPGRRSITIAAIEGSPVQAVHPGTVDFAGVFVGFGNLVILDHGSNTYSLYGYLRSIEVARGARVEAGGQVGEVGTPPVGPAALYFELRIDGRSVDPVQWLKPR